MSLERIPVSKEEFVDIICKLKDAKELVDKVNDLFLHSRENVECDFCNAASLQISHETLVIELLQKLMKDELEMTSFYIYELNYGEEYECGKVISQNGKDIILNTPESLYDFLIAEYRKDEVKMRWEH